MIVVFVAPAKVIRGAYNRVSMREIRKWFALSREAYAESVSEGIPKSVSPDGISLYPSAHTVEHW